MKITLKSAIKLLCAGILVLFFSGCAALGSQPTTIALIAPANTLSKEAVEGLRAAAREENARLWVANPPPANLEEEADRLAQALARKPAALIFAPISPEGSLTSLSAAAEAGLPVICLEKCVNEPGVASAFLPGPNRDAGGLIGDLALQYIVTNLDGQAEVALLPCDETPGCGLRQAEFTGRLRQMPNVGLLSSEPGLDTAGVRAFLSSHPEVNLIWAGGVDETRAVLRAASELGLEGKFKLFGFGLDEELAGLLGDEGLLYATVVPLEYQSGYDAGGLALALAQGKAAPAVMRKNALTFIAYGPAAKAFLTGPSPYLLPTLPSLPETGSGIKPSCNCDLDKHPVVPTPTP